MKKLVLVIFSLAVFSIAKSQTKEISGVKKVVLSNVSVIGSKTDVKGYFAFYAMEKSDKGMVNYKLELLNDNLMTTHSIDIKKPKNTFLLEGKFNGSNFCFSFLDYKEKTLSFDIYDLNGKKTGSNLISDVDAQYLQILYMQLQNEDAFISGGLMEIPNQGFICTYAKKGKGMKIFADMIDNKGKRKWTVGSGNVEKSFEQFTLLHANAESIFFTINSKPGALSSELTIELIQVNSSDGKVVSKNKFSDKKNSYITFGVDKDAISNEYIVYGEYYKLVNGKMSFKDKEGFFVKRLDSKGKELATKDISWSKDLSSKIKVGDKGKLEDGVAIFVHNIIKTKNGKYYAIAEQFNKTVSAGGVALGVLAAAGGGSSGVSMSKITISNMMVFELNSDLTLNDVYIFNKNKSNVALPAGAGMVDENTLGMFVKVYGGFDYLYTSTNAANDKFQSVYVNYNRSASKEEGKYTVGFIGLDDSQKIVDAKINLKTKPTSFVVFPSKPGYFVIFEYYKKEKKVSFRMEKADM